MPGGPRNARRFSALRDAPAARPRVVEGSVFDPRRLVIQRVYTPERQFNIAWVDVCSGAPKTGKDPKE
jgi:hypothetical protein